MKRLMLAAVVGILGGVGVAREARAVEFGCQARTFGLGVCKDEASFLAVVRQVGQLGFAGLETNWKNLERYFDRPAEFAAILDGARLKLIAAHMGGSPWNTKGVETLREDVGRTAEFVEKLGCHYVVFSGALPKEPLPPDTWQTMARFVNDVARICAVHGVKVLYHNHWRDCEGDALETLCELTDPERVGFAFDTGHALHAGKDPAALIGVMGRRLELVHFADYAGDRGSATQRPPLGEGCLKIAEVVAALRRAGFKGWIVLEEETSSADGRTLAERGLATFRRAFSQAK